MPVNPIVASKNKICIVCYRYMFSWDDYTYTIFLLSPGNLCSYFILYTSLFLIAEMILSSLDSIHFRIKLASFFGYACRQPCKYLEMYLCICVGI